MVYRTIRLCAGNLKSDIPAQEFYVMNLPGEAKDFIRRLTARRDNRPIEETTLPVKSLYKGLRLAPGLIRVGKVLPAPGEYFLYSPH